MTKKDEWPPGSLICAIRDGKRTVFTWPTLKLGNPHKALTTEEGELTFMTTKAITINFADYEPTVYQRILIGTELRWTKQEDFLLLKRGQKKKHGKA